MNSTFLSIICPSSFTPSSPDQLSTPHSPGRTDSFSRSSLGQVKYQNNAQLRHELQMMSGFFWDHIESCIVGNTQNEMFERVKNLVVG